jgi:hypothetical protein
MYIPNFIKIGSNIQELIGGDSQTHTDSVEIAYAYSNFFSNKGSRLTDKNIAKHKTIVFPHKEIIV